MSVIQSGSKHPERCVIGHPFNPPHMIPLAEVVGGKKTSPEAIQQAMAFYASIRKKPIHLRKELSDTKYRIWLYSAFAIPDPL